MSIYLKSPENGNDGIAPSNFFTAVNISNGNRFGGTFW